MAVSAMAAITINMVISPPDWLPVGDQTANVY